MRRSHPLLHFAAMAVLIQFAGCEGSRPLEIVQLCVRDEQGITDLKSALKSIAEEQNMKFVDGSSATARDLREMAQTDSHIHAHGGLLYVGVERGDGLGLEAGNLGLNTYDIAVGFSGSPTKKQAQAFADFVKARLAARWPLKSVPQNRGALPDPTCAFPTKPGPPPNNSFKPKPLRGSA